MVGVFASTQDLCTTPHGGMILYGRPATAKNDLGAISWNLLSGGEDAEGNLHSPDMILFHELQHADSYIGNLLEFVKGVLTAVDKMDNKEEEKAIKRTTTLLL